MKCGRLFVAAVTVLITVPYLIAAPFIIWPLFHEDTLLLIANEVFAAVGIVALLRVYFKASNTPPGYVPADWKPDDRPDSASYVHSKRCDKCQAWKPPRSHHCSDCRRCVLKMDHHCPWINNCVGHRNHKLFLLFLLYATTMISYLLVLCGLRFYVLISRFKPPRMAMADVQEILWLSILTIVMLSLVLSIGSLLVYQLWLVSQNKTTIDSYKHAKEVHEARRSGEKSKIYYPFDLGSVLANMRETLGPSVWTWFFITAPVGNGLQWRTSQRSVVDIEGQSLTGREALQEQTLVQTI